MQTAHKLTRTLTLAVLLLVGCSTPPVAPPISPAEQVRHDREEGLKLAKGLEKSLKLKQDPQVSAYLRQLAEGFVEKDSALAGTPVEVFLVQDAKTWRSYGVPGIRIYLSLGLLKSLEFENEVAAVLAYQLAHVSQRTALDRVEKEEADPFAFDSAAQDDAATRAVAALYQSGYDPRGLVSIWTRYQENPSRSPIKPASVDRLLDRTRQDIARHAPLRNPVVRSRAFLEMQKRIKRL